MCGSASGLGSGELGQRFAPTIRPQHALPSLSSQSSGGVTVHRSSVNARHASTLRPTIVMATKSALFIAVFALSTAIAWGIFDDIHPSRGERHRRQGQVIYGQSTVRYQTPNFSGVQSPVSLPYQPVSHISYVTDSTRQKSSQPFYPQQQLTSIRYPESARLGLPEPIRPVQSTVATHEQLSSFLPTDSQQFYLPFSPQQQTTFQPSYVQSSFAEPREPLSFGSNGFQPTTFEPTYTRTVQEPGISALSSQHFTINKPAESLPIEQNNANFGYRQSSYSNYIPTSRPNFPGASTRDFDRQAFQVGVGTPAFWTEWSSWSSCIYQAQHRTRSCDYGNNALASGCLGKAAESLPCVGNGIPDPRNAFGNQNQNGIADPRNAFGSQIQNGITDPRNAFGSQNQNGITDPRNAFGSQIQNGITDPRNAFGSQNQIETNANTLLGRRASSPAFYSQATDTVLSYGQVQPTIRTYGGAAAIIPIGDFRKTAKSASKVFL